MRAVPVTPRQVMFTVCGQCPSLHAEGLKYALLRAPTQVYASGRGDEYDIADFIMWFELQSTQSESFVGRIWKCDVVPVRPSVRPPDTHFHARRSIFCDSSVYLSPLGHAAI